MSHPSLSVFNPHMFHLSGLEISDFAICTSRSLSFTYAMCFTCLPHGGTEYSHMLQWIHNMHISNNSSKFTYQVNDSGTSKEDPGTVLIEFPWAERESKTLGDMWEGVGLPALWVLGDNEMMSTDETAPSWYRGINVYIIHLQGKPYGTIWPMFLQACSIFRRIERIKQRDSGSHRPHFHLSKWKEPFHHYDFPGITELSFTRGKALGSLRNAT